MRPGRTVLMCQANLVVCPHCRSQQLITVGTRANRHAGRNQFRGRGTTACECGGEFMFHTADGGTVVIALWGDEAAHLDMDEPLPRIWARLGLLQVA